MNRKNDLYPFIFEQSVHTKVVIACFDELSKTLKKKTVVVMDNASVHTSEEFEECLPQWKKQGLIIKYLTTYSPELNLIEILWRNIKALVGFQGRGFADGVQPDFCHAFLLEAFIFQ